MAWPVSVCYLVFLLLLIVIVEKHGLLSLNCSLVSLVGVVLDHHVDSHFCLDLFLLGISFENQGKFDFRFMRDQLGFYVLKQSLIHLWEGVKEDSFQGE